MTNSSFAKKEKSGTLRILLIAGGIVAGLFIMTVIAFVAIFLLLDYL
jgi:hypothetical protein